ncbi:MAG: hypothetical protein HY787_10205 [Deltaproteobacteria bacterium]|nr:hypothetical protein [Deltaproteobacteria bacterium]
MSERSISLILKSGRKSEGGVIIASEAIVVVDVVESTLTSNLFGWYAVGRGLMRDLRRAVQNIGANHNLLCTKSTGDGYLLAYGNERSGRSASGLLFILGKSMWWRTIGKAHMSLILSDWKQ